MLDKVAALVREAGGIVRKGYQRVDEKSSVSDVVTDCDIAVQRFLMDRLKELFADIGFICEETVGDPTAGIHEFVAVIDPVDGTSNFVRGMNLSAVSVGVLRHGLPWLGVVYLPFSDELFTAETGRGAYCNGERIRVSQRGLAASCMATAWSLYDKSLAQPCFDICQEIYPQIDDFRRLGSCALELCYLACGRCELFFEIRVFPWDHAAAALIVTEAGGVVKILGAEYGDYSRPASIIAANSASSLNCLEQVVKKHLPEKIYERSAFNGIL